MADRILRVEKLDDKERTLYVEFQREARNAVTRLWNSFGVSGLNVSHKERENFHDSSDVERYIKNARAQYVKQGYKEIKPPKAAPSETLVLE